MEVAVTGEPASSGFPVGPIAGLLRLEGVTVRRRRAKVSPLPSRKRDDQHCVLESLAKGLGPGQLAGVRLWCRWHRDVGGVSPGPATGKRPHTRARAASALLAACTQAAS